MTALGVSHSLSSHPKLIASPPSQRNDHHGKKKKLMQLTHQGSVTTVPMLCGKLALQERDALLRGEFS